MTVNAAQPAIIFAPATPAGQSGVAVYRISGQNLNCVFEHLGINQRPKPREAALRRLRKGTEGELIDEALVLYFPAPHSFTGEEVIELQTHGGSAIRQTLLNWLSQLEGCRLAEAGEFSRRAFTHGKMDLLQAEGIADLIAAETSMQQQQALRQMGGALSEQYEQMRADILRALALLEAYLDFPDEEIPEETLTQTSQLIDRLIGTIEALLTEPPSGEMIREGMTIAIIGPPNAGKSSLLNRLAGREAAIVTDIAGTTRDRVEVHLNLHGYFVRLIDTAGLRETHDTIEAEGVRRARESAAQAQLTLMVLDIVSDTELSAESLAYLPENAILVINKCDQFNNDAAREHKRKALPENLAALPTLWVSARDDIGIDTLIERITTEISQRVEACPSPLLTRTRHRQALYEAYEHLNQLAQQSALPLELYAEELRLAARAIGKITGHIDVDQLLDVIFREFCIGK